MCYNYRLQHGVINNITIEVIEVTVGYILVMEVSPFIWLYTYVILGYTVKYALTIIILRIWYTKLLNI